MATAKFKTTGMHCPSCSMLIGMDLEETDGVESVDCSLATGMTQVTFDESLVDAETLRQVIVDAGYGAEPA